MECCYASRAFGIHRTNASAGFICASKLGFASSNLKGWRLVNVDGRRNNWRWACNASMGRNNSPLKPQSAAGQFLHEILDNHSHLFDVAATQQLQKLAAERDAAIARQQLSQSDAESVLHRRIAELKVGECRAAAEEVIYLLIVQKFGELSIPMVPKLMSCVENRTVDSWPSKDRELESVHTPEVLEMIEDHLSMILGQRGGLNHGDNHTMIQFDRLSLGRVYAASIMYGYFLRRAYQRFQLEVNLETVYPYFIDRDNMKTQFMHSEESKISIGGECLASEVGNSIPIKADVWATSDLHTSSFLQDRSKPGKLRSYIMSFDAETLQRCATMRARESVNVIEKHAAALFGRPEMHIASNGSMAVTNDKTIRLTYSSLRRLVLEAVAFGSFLWDVEDYVDSLYNLTGN
eukprot:Gb_32078 [translate_table: standard]